MPAPRTLRPLLALAVLTAPLALLVGSSQASDPVSSAITVPAAGGQTVVRSYSGTAPPGAFPTSSCDAAPAQLSDSHDLGLTVPPGAARKTQLSFATAWTDASPAGNDLILSVFGPDGAVVGQSDGGSPAESVTIDNPVAGTYTAVTCGFANPTPQPYKGTITLKTLATASAVGALPTVDRGLEFSATTPSDVQKSQGEPAVTIAKDGTLYTCGTNGASNGTDHASVSVDGGQSYRIVGTPPTGTLGTVQGGGDCALAVGQDPLPTGTYPLAYAGLGPLTGFSTATSDDNGRTLRRSPTQNETPVDQMAGVDRQWIVFSDEKTVFLNYNSFPVGGQVVQKSTDAGQTYGAALEVATDGSRLGQIRAIPQGTIAGITKDVIYFPYNNGNQVKLALSTDGGDTWSQCLAATAAADPTAGFQAANHDKAGNIYVTWAEKGGGRDTFLTALRAADVAKCKGSAPVAMSAENDVNPGFTTPIRVNREGVETTVMPWVAAGGISGRVAVAFYGTRTEGNPDSGAIDATWNVYVSQTLDPFAATPAIDQVQATTHPFHYDSICLNGLGCTTSNPAMEGDRSLVDYFTMEYDDAGDRLVIVYSQPAKIPDAASGNLSTPAVLVQRAGPSNDGGVVTGRPVLATGVADPAGDAFANYTSSTGGPTGPVASLPSAPEPAFDITKVEVLPEQDVETGEPVPNGGFTVRLTVPGISTAALATALPSSGNASAIFLFRYVDGYQASAVGAYYSPVTGFSFGRSGYAESTANVAGPVLVYPGATPVPGAVEPDSGTITMSVPRDQLVELAGSQGPGQRPVEQKAKPGTRFYDASAFTLLNPLADPKTHTYLDTAEQTPSFDFVLPGAAAPIGRAPGRAPAVAGPGSSPGTGGGTGGSTGGGLAATGLPLALPLLGLAGLAVAVVVRRRTR